MNDERRERTEAEIDEAIKFFGNEEPIGDGKAEDNDAVIEWCDGGHAGPGWYIWSDEYPEEGSSLLSTKPEPSPRILKHLQLQAAEPKAGS